MLSAMPASGQSKRQSQAAAKAQAAKAAKEAEQRIEQMVAATQKVMFIDSVVVDKDAFLTKYNLCQDAGRLYKYDDFFKAKDQANAYVYVNGLGDKCYFSREDSVGDFNLYTSDNLSGSWTPAARLDGLDDDAGHKSMNYPFMMADGSTLYFAATGDESIGGYDIFATRFDSERGTFLKAENIGMPFNSTANDYMYAIDEFNNIGWFATDRNQSEGKVCIYMFVPSDSRQLYSPDEYSEEQIRSLANLNRIADTWGDGKERQLAMERLKAMQSEKVAMAAKGSFSFVVNDIIATGSYRGAPSLGITVTTVEKDGGGTQVQVVEVSGGSGAADAGIQAGDVILAADGQPISVTSDLLTVRRSHVIGDTVTLTILRDGQQFDVEVVLRSNRSFG